MVLKESLIKLMAEKPIDKIQIKEICELADVNRGTFYNHYNDQFDLLRQVQNEFANEVEALREKRQSEGMDTTDMIAELVEYLGEQLSLCKILFNTNGGNELINKLMTGSYEVFLETWKQKLKNPSERQLEMLYCFISNGASASIRNWVLSDKKETPREVAEFIQKVSLHGSSAFIE